MSVLYLSTSTPVYALIYAQRCPSVRARARGQRCVGAVSRRVPAPAGPGRSAPGAGPAPGPRLPAPGSRPAAAAGPPAREDEPMAGKEPLLGALKGGVLRLREGAGPCTDASPHLASLCQLLESILRKGLRQPAWGFRRRDYWHWLEQLPTGDGGRPTPLSISIQKAGGCEKARTAQGRGRYFLRLALQGKVLAAAVRQLARTPWLLEVQHTARSL
ncbi:uncharacterized protein LOC142091204 [Calonectris borealis]|uniref:uncharacterized protein LOC142091204 n=1 Tax=Calonectris borealis TaxID=1323832 RepID=UPI003F4C1B16